MDLTRNRSAQIRTSKSAASTRTWSFYAVATLFLICSGARAATLNVAGGELLGASGVSVGGSLYDVSFADGTCVALFSGCNSPADFAFQSFTDATLGAQALLDQVFHAPGADQFDMFPELTVGCSDTFQCLVVTPYGGGGQSVQAFVAYNYSQASSLTDIVQFGTDSSTFDLLNEPKETFAVWNLVPEPGTALLLGLGLVGLGRKAATGRG